MIVDANVLLYAVDASSQFHQPARNWVCSTDSDFARFPQITWVNPLTR
jgi:predicted nucleic acid-binding protein